MRDKGHSFLRVYRIIELVAGSPWPISYAEISDRLELTKPTAHRLCELLESQSIIQRAVDGKSFIPGPRLRFLSMEVLGSSNMLLERQLVLQSLADKTGETCNLTVPVGTEMLYLDRVETEWPLRIALPVGSRVPLHCTASGKLYLSQLASRERRRLIGSIKLERFTENTIVDSEALWEELRNVREEGVGVDNEEFVEGMVAISVPINDTHGRICATLAVHGPLPRLTVAKAMSHVPCLREAAERLEATISAGKSKPAK